MQYLEIINSVILIALAVAFYIQNNSLKFMKSAMDAYQPEKLKQAQEFIEKGNEHKINLMVSEKINSIVNDSGKRFMEVNQSFHEGYDELIKVPYMILKDKDWKTRESYLKKLPKNAEFLRKILEASDNGSLDEFFDKQK